jgi:hypothetical protein
MRRFDWGIQSAVDQSPQWRRTCGFGPRCTSDCLSKTFGTWIWGILSGLTTRRSRLDKFFIELAFVISLKDAAKRLLR